VLNVGRQAMLDFTRGLEIGKTAVSRDNILIHILCERYVL
jgi:hypothetical protein